MEIKKRGSERGMTKKENEVDGNQKTEMREGQAKEKKEGGMV